MYKYSVLLRNKGVKNYYLKQKNILNKPLIQSVCQ